MFTRRSLLGGLAALATLTAGVANAETVLRFSNWVPMTHPLSSDVMVPWAKEVEEATDGRIKIEFVSPLGAPPAHLDIALNGIADITFIVHSYTSDRFPLMELGELPFVAPDSRTASLAFWDTYEKFIEGAHEHRGVHLLGAWGHGPAHLFTGSKEITSLDDLSGMKIRVAGGMSKNAGEGLGVVPFFAPSSQSYEVISKGVADGILFPTESVYNFKIGPAIKYALKVPGGLYRSVQGIIMNEGVWDGLSDEDKEAINSVSGKHLAALAATMWDTQDALGEEELTKAGTKFTTASGEMLEAIHAKLEPYTEAWLDAGNGDIDRKAAYDYFLERIAYYEENPEAED
ncbi:TRAP transporter substrate-binding protein [Oceanicella sp. SM1341]|uniref:TRAP transporter substrate-binding protein n=1 Tax=Oceanicella sp. SM1341 TaxID=1548889 RepID=UPI000E48FC13|nr:TRAP transporter substrate-binding protein [Oceanicella sp. SM1341]